MGHGSSNGKLSAGLKGVAGEYFVAAELSRRGYVASITLRNTRGIDIIASSEDGLKAVTIQVKTCQAGQRHWLLSQKAEDFFATNHFYVFVTLNEPMPDYLVVPSEVVAEQVKRENDDFLAALGKRGKLRKATSMRMFVDRKNQYMNRWDLLGLDIVEPEQLSA